MPKELRRAPDSLSVWESNMKDLARRQPNLALLLERYVAVRGHDFSHYENQTPAGRWIEGLTDEPFFERDGEPKFNWSRTSREDKNKPVFILYGAGTPPYLFKAIKALPEAALSLIVVEPNISMIAYTLHLTHVYQALPERCLLSFLTEAEDEGAAGDEQWNSKNIISRALIEECMITALNPVGIYAAALAALSSHEGETDAYGGEFRRLGAKMKEWVAVRLTLMGNSAEDTLLGFRQTAINSPLIAFGKPLELIKDKFSGRPAILVSAGPSLDKNFRLLEAVQDKCLIISVDAVLGKLLENGVKPHIVTSLERGLIIYDLFFSRIVERFRKECKDILLVAQGVSIPWTPGRWPGPVCFINKSESTADVWFAGGMLGGFCLRSGTSVAHVNYSLADYVNCSNIAIIGQDLAYGDEGITHAGSIKGRHKADTSQAIEIPGSMGGTVKTNNIWLSFLRLLEDLIIEYSRPAWDCTEGGALIANTRVAPLAEFIGRFVEGEEPMDITPASCVRDGHNDVEFSEIGGRVLANIAAQYKLFDEIDRSLDDVERLMESTAAAGLEPARRVEYAARTDEVLDAIHNSSPAFDYIAQSYTRLASIELAQTRSLEDVETVRRWHAAHKDILDSHRMIMAFIRRWVSHAERAIAFWAGRGKMKLGPVGGEKAWEVACKRMELLEGAADDEERRNARFLLDHIMIRCDPVRLKWPGRFLWKYAMLLMADGRAAIAVRFMNAAAADFDGKEMPVAEMAAFFKDYARVLMGRDLVHRPDLFKAENMLANAADLIGADDEIRNLMSDLLDTEVAFSEMMDEYKGFASRGQAAWYADRAVAQRRLYEGDLKGAIEAVWIAIKKHWRTVPEWTASHLDWLVKTLEKCVDAADPAVAETADAIMTDMVKNGEILYNTVLNYNIAFVRMLEARGLNVSWKRVEEKITAE